MMVVQLHFFEFVDYVWTWEELGTMKFPCHHIVCWFEYCDYNFFMLSEIHHSLN